MFWYLLFLINMMIYYLCFLFDMGYCCVDRAVPPALGLRSSFDSRHIPPHPDHYCPPTFVCIPGPPTQGLMHVNQVLLLVYVP